MISQQMIRSFGIAIPVVTGAILLLGKSWMETNILNTGIIVATILGIANLGVAWAIYKHRI